MGTALGWFVGHYFSGRRDLANERRKVWSQYLIEAYRRLEGATYRLDGWEHLPDVESALADIQLFGTAKQVNLALAFIALAKQKGGSNTQPLLNDLRDSLRRELQLDPVSLPPQILRVVPKEEWEKAPPFAHQHFKVSYLSADQPIKTSPQSK